MKRKMVRKWISLFSVGLLSGCSSPTNPEKIVYLNGKTENNGVQTIFFDKDDEMSFQILRDMSNEFVTNYEAGTALDYNIDCKDIYYPIKLSPFPTLYKNALKYSF